MNTPCPICGAPYGFHDDGHGLRIPADWSVESLIPSYGGSDVEVVWIDERQQRHWTWSRPGLRVQRGSENVVVPLAPWASIADA